MGEEKAKFDASDIFSSVGLVLVGVGVGFWFGVPQALTCIGLLLLIIGFFGK